MSHVFVLDTHKQPVTPVHPSRARWLLKHSKAAVFKRYPFTIILLSAVESPQVQPLRIKLDPGSQTTGIAIVDDHSGRVLFAAELAHRGQEIKKALAKGGFTLTTATGKVPDVGKKYCCVLQQADGYRYSQQGARGRVPCFPSSDGSA